MTMSRLTLAVLVAVAGLSAPGAEARAQGTQSSTITGIAIDGTRAVVPGVAVTIASPALIGGPRAATTDVDGAYRFTSLAPGSYEVTATLQGFRSMLYENVRLAAGMTITLDFELQVAPVAEAVTVPGTGVTIDVKSSASPTHLEQDLLQNLPTRRSLPALINLTPGVSGDVSFGGSQASNALYVDGVSTTEANFQEPRTRFNYNWVQEVQVVALGADAEHGQFTGVAANSVLRSGSNRFSGLAEYWTIRPAWVGRNTSSLTTALRDEFKPREVLTFWDSGVQLGGPLRRDRVWFFSGVQYSHHDDRPAGFNGPGSRDERDRQFLTKLTAAPASAVRLEGFYEGGLYTIHGDEIDRFRPIEASQDVRAPQNTWNAQLTWTISDRTLFQGRASGFVSPATIDPYPPNTRSGPAPRFDLVTGRYSGSVDAFADIDSRNQRVAASLTHHHAGFLGRRHDVKAGLEHERYRARDLWGFPGGQSYYDLDGEPYLVNFWEAGATRVRTDRPGLYAQDNWTVSDRVTVNAGVRVDINRGSVPVRGTTFSTTPVSPRIGVAWDVRGDHRTVVRAHYGRYHDAIFSSRIGSTDDSEERPFVTALVTGPNQFREIDRSEPADDFAIDRNIKHSYVDQYVVGVERELLSDVSVLAQVIRRDFGNYMGMTDTGSVYEAVQRRDPGRDGRPGTADDGDL